MAFSLFLQLYGCAETCERARALLENLPQIRRIDGKKNQASPSALIAHFRRRVSFSTQKKRHQRLFLLPLMPIVYAFSRNGSPLSL